MIPELFTLNIQQGDTLNVAWQLKDDDDDIITLTGFSGSCEVRQHSDDALILTATITIDASNGIFYVQSTAATTALLTPSEEVLNYDVKLIKGVFTATPIHGKAVILPEITAT